jgi:hypothetical protein
MPVLRKRGRSASRQLQIRRHKRAAMLRIAARPSSTASSSACARVRCPSVCVCPFAKCNRCPTCGPKSSLCKVRACVAAREGAGPSNIAE